MKTNEKLNKVALITGGTSGIGEEIAKTLLKERFDVFVLYASNDEKAKKSYENLVKINSNTKVYVLKADQSNEESMKLIFDKIKETTGRLDVVVNNAGINVDCKIEDIKISDFERIVNVNLTGKLITTKLSIPLLKKSKCPRIINIASRLGTKPMEESCSYCCAQAGIIMLTKMCAVELAKYGIRTNTISPAMTLTPLALNSYTENEIKTYIQKNPCGRAGKTTDIANMVKFLVSDEAEFINGENINVNGGILLV